MKKDDYQLIKATLISVDGLSLIEQIEQVKIKCKEHPELIDTIIKMLENDALDNEQDKNDVFTSPPILEHVPSADIPIQILEPDTQINQYSVIEKIGSGGMGVVYSAQQQYPAERLVALKLISHLPNQEQLIRETNTLAQLNHPNIATLFEIDEFEIEKDVERHLYIAMELIKGQDIIQWCKTHHYTDTQKIELFQQLCSGITYAHEKGVIHCDIKPSNVLVTKKNHTATVKIIDFGISQHNSHNTKSDEISGTPAYLAPEVLINKLHVLADTRRDVYAMGVLLDKLLSKNRDYDLQAIVNKATANDKELRYSTAEKLSNDLSHYFSNKPLTARDNNWWYLSALYLKRRFVLVTVSLAFVGLLVGGYIIQAKQATAALIAQKEAEEVSAFLTELFDVANPERSDDKIASSYDLLNKAKDKLLAIETPDLSDARFLHTIGSIFTRMDKLEDARVVIEKSLLIKNSRLPENDRDVIAGTIQLGLLYKNLSLNEKSEHQLQTAINTLQMYENSDLSQLAYAHNHLGNLYKKSRKLDDAVIQHKAAIALREELGDRRLLADSYNNLGAILLVQHKYTESRQFILKALSLYESEYDVFHPFVGIAKSNLSRLEENVTHDFNQVEKYLLEALHIFKNSYGANHFNTITLQTNVLWFYNRRMQYEKAINFIRENSESVMASEKYEKIISFNWRMGMTYTRTKQFDKAAQLYLQALEMAHSNQVTERDLVEKLYVGYAENFIEQQLYSLAQEQLNKALKHSKDRVPEFIPYQLKVINKIADLDLKKDDFESAKSHYLNIISHTENSRLYNLEYIKAYIGLSKIHSTEKDFVNDQEALTKARELTVTMNRENLFMGKIDYQQGLLFISQDQMAAARESLEKAHALQSKTLPKIHPELIATEQALNTLN